MAVNRYTNLPRFNYAGGPKYVEMPFNEYVGFGEQAKQDYENTADTLGKAASLVKINTDPKSIQIANNLQNVYNKELASIADDFEKNKDVQSTRARTRDLATRWVNDPLRQNLELSGQQFKINQEAAQKSGEKYVDFYDEYNRFNPINSSEYKPFLAKPLKERQDYIKRGSELVKDIALDKTAWDDVKGVNQYGQLESTKGTLLKLDDTKIGKIADRLVDPMLQTDEGKYFVDEFINKYRPNTGSVNYDELPKEIKNEIRKSIKNNLVDLAWKQRTSQSTFDRSMINLPDAAVADIIKTGTSVPVYESPSVDIPSGSYNPSDFDVRPSGSKIEYTPEEAQKMREGKFGRNLDFVNQKLTEGKGRTSEVVISQPNELRGKNKDLIFDILETQYPNLYDKAKKGEKISIDELAPIYNIAKKQAEILDKDIKVNSQAIPLNVKESENLQKQFFGEKEPNTKNMGSGFAGNLKFYYDGEVKTYDQFKKDFPESEVRVSGKFKPNHPYSYLTKEKGYAEDFRSPKQLFVNGKQVLISNPKYYEDENGSLSNEQQVRLDRESNSNKLSEVRYTIAPKVVKLEYKSLGNEGKKEVKTMFIPTNPDDRTQGKYMITDKNGDPLITNSDGTPRVEFDTPEQAEALIFEKLLFNAK